MQQGVIGFFVFIFLAWIFSENRKKLQLRAIVPAFGLQLVLAIILTKFDVLKDGFFRIGQGVQEIKNATLQGTQFVFGYIGGGQSPFMMDPSGQGSTFIFALQALPMIIVISAISMLLFYWRIMPLIVNTLSWFFQKTLNIGGALGVAAGAKVFLGNIDAPLLIRPYLKDFSRSELFTIMTCGMATTSATVMALYADILKGAINNPIQHILICSIISVPAAIAISRLMVPHEGKETDGKLTVPYKFTGWMDAISKGTSDGLGIFMNVVAMLIVALAMVYIANCFLGILPDVGGAPLSLQRIFGYIFAPVTWLMGIPWHESQVAGSLLGTKTVVNEVVAFSEMSKLQPGSLSPSSSIIMTYALCGFANFSAVGIVIGGLGAMVPERRDVIVELGLKSIVSGTLATCLSGTIVGLLR